MEEEYKWMLPADVTFEKILANTLISEHIQSHETITMLAVYYDTPDGLMHELGGSLRFRRENENAVCCMKITREKQGACALREEYEVQAENMTVGLPMLKAAGAPAEVCDKIDAAHLCELCGTDYTRNAYLLEVSCNGSRFTAELALDSGLFCREGRSLTFSEAELEHKSGDAQAFHAFAKLLEYELKLIPQPLSKLARALRV